MRMIKNMFHAGFNLFRGCSSFSKVTSTTSKKMAHAPWDQLPIEIWSLIYELLDLEDRIRFNIVCREWRTIKKKTPQHPWLMLPHDPNDQYLSFFDMCEGKVRKLKLPESVQGGWFYGCSKGWLFLAIGTHVHNLRIFLFDPISRAQIPLPPLSTISSFEDGFEEERPEWNPAAWIIGEVEVSSSDASQCIVAVEFCENDRILALCTPQSERWTIVEGLLPYKYRYGDLSFFHGDLYACILTSNEANHNQVPNFQTHSISLGSHCVNLKLIATPPPTYLVDAADADEIMVRYDKDCSRWSYFVESNGQLLMVTEIHDAISAWNVNDEDDHVDEDDRNLLLYFQTATFQVFKIQTTDDILSITKMTDLGNLSVFVGAGCCLAAENPDKFDKNCIYFLQEHDYCNENEYPSVCREAGVYYLGDGSMKRCFPSIKTDKPRLFMYWISPNLESLVRE